jgi:hypothetical protein
VVPHACGDKGLACPTATKAHVGKQTLFSKLSNLKGYRRDRAFEAAAAATGLHPQQGEVRSITIGLMTFTVKPRKLSTEELLKHERSVS